MCLGHVPELFGRLRIVPDVADAAVLGMQIFGVRSDGIAAALGFQNGDRVEAINGHSLTTPDSALAAYADVQNANRIELRISRATATITLVYELIE